MIKQKVIEKSRLLQKETMTLTHYKSNSFGLFISEIKPNLNIQLTPWMAK